LTQSRGVREHAAFGLFAVRVKSHVPGLYPEMRILAQTYKGRGDHEYGRRGSCTKSASACR
jgi:hypothetical protein